MARSNRHRATPDWPYREGLITTLVEEIAPSPKDAISIACGPPIMIKFAMLTLSRLGLKSEQNWVTLEAKMKCGIGKCGRCNLGGVFICTDGPVFCFAQVEQFLESFAWRVILEAIDWQVLSARARR